MEDRMCKLKSIRIDRVDEGVVVEGMCKRDGRCMMGDEVEVMCNDVLVTYNESGMWVESSEYDMMCKVRYNNKLMIMKE